MGALEPDPLRVDRTAIEVAELGGDGPDADYWADATVEERLAHMEYLRRVNYGPAAIGPMERVLEVGRRE